MKRPFIVVVVSFFVAVSALAQNALVNGNFEVNPPPVGSFGNHTTQPVAPWVAVGGTMTNVVKVDGPGGYSYGPFGDDSSATVFPPHSPQTRASPSCRISDSRSRPTT